jgi:hypothetical protein
MGSCECWRNRRFSMPLTNKLANMDAPMITQ